MGLNSLSSQLFKNFSFCFLFMSSARNLRFVQQIFGEDRGPGTVVRIRGDDRVKWSQWFQVGDLVMQK